MNYDPISDLKRYAAALEEQVSDDRARSAARMALHTPAPTTLSPTRAPRRVVVAIATTVLMGVSNVALAAAANPSVPGDPLYGLDRAYESVGAAVGLSGSHASERATEVLALQERGKSAEALDLVQETLNTLLDADDPKAAVREFTAGLGNVAFADTLQALLSAARGVDTTGEAVSKIARSIVDSIVLPEQANGNPGGKSDPAKDGNNGNGTNGNNGNGNENSGEQGQGNNPNTGAGTPGSNGQGGGKP